MVSRKASLFLFGIAVAACARVQAQARPEAPEYDVKEHYTKYEYRIAMRDGVRLFTAVDVPKDLLFMETGPQAESLSHARVTLRLLFH